MKKALFVGSSTLVGVVGVLSYTPPAVDVSALGTPAATTTESTSSPTTPDSGATQATQSPVPTTNGEPNADSTAKATPAAASPTQTSTSTPTKSALSGTFDGATSQTRWGPVQVRIVLENGKITSASALQYPDRDNRSLWISQQAIPWLVNQTLKAQSADLDGVGGATYTTNGWITSLQSALSKAGI